MIRILSKAAHTSVVQKQADLLIGGVCLHSCSLGKSDSTGEASE